MFLTDDCKEVIFVRLNQLLFLTSKIYVWISKFCHFTCPWTSSKFWYFHCPATQQEATSHRTDQGRFGPHDLSHFKPQCRTVQLETVVIYSQLLVSQS